MTRDRCMPARRARRPGPLVLVAIVVVAASLSACGISGSPGGTASSSRRASTTTLPQYELTTRDLHGLGTVLVDGDGFTLYLFMPDEHSGRSTCVGDCAAQWPPLVLPAGVAAPVAGPGVNASLLGTTRRTDGSVQVTYNGWPLYLWPLDTAPGQATGQGINNLGGLWYVENPDGNPIR
jgi:predicted lipoprotein with Yx(FWY)xxD motif